MTAIATKQLKKQTARFKSKATSTSVMEGSEVNLPPLSRRSPSAKRQRESLSDWDHAS